MGKPLEQWKVLPHGKLVEVDENILSVVGQIHMPLVDFPRRMTIVRLKDRRLIVFNAIALDEDEMLALEGYGHMAFLIVPNDHHRLDAPVWKQRYPYMEVVTPEGARKKVAEVVAVDTSMPQFGDENVHFVTVPGTHDREAALLVHGPHGSTLVLNDIVGNIRHASGFEGWFLRMLGFAGDEANVPTPVKLTLHGGKEALRKQLLQWADLATLKRILVSHGEPITERPDEVLRDLAASLE
ncbi:hypothetical protein VVD49_08555 [Uliginosibacterium sp. H3]|uniref:DUF4336 domain-containing protein n=1 Tax=Uliginosibacterium silvisoli TaxID=3114758 RepID=A0ABU6K1G1_9RHOO|nr:hypothetical protein [Uliginosibacterium sp. H3]